MRRLILSGLAIAFAGASFATSPFFIKDWPAGSGAGINCTISSFDDSYTGTGTVSLETSAGVYTDFNDRIGIYNYLFDNSYRINVLCAELDRNRDSNDYEYKDISGTAGYLANQINVVLATYTGSDLIDHSMALGLATWELAYDYAPYGYTFADGSMDLSSGAFIAGAGISDNVKDLAKTYALSAIRYQSSDYRMYHAPRGGDLDNGSQDLIGSSVPGPMAALPFLMGFGLALRRRQK